MTSLLWVPVAAAVAVIVIRRLRDATGYRGEWAYGIRA